MSLRGDLRSGEELLGEALCAQAGLRAGPPKRGGVVDLTLGHQVDQYDGSVAVPTVVGAQHHGAQAQHRGDQGHREHARERSDGHDVHGCSAICSMFTATWPFERPSDARSTSSSPMSPFAGASRR